jgi:hypothetical protein
MSYFYETGVVQFSSFIGMLEMSCGWSVAYSLRNLFMSRIWDCFAAPASLLSRRLWSRPIHRGHCPLPPPPLLPVEIAGGQTHDHRGWRQRRGHFCELFTFSVKGTPILVCQVSEDVGLVRGRPVL